MMDGWTAIRHSVREVLNRYAQGDGAAPFTAERGSYAILGDIARHGLPEPFRVLHSPNLPEGMFVRLSLAKRAIQVCSDLDETRQTLATAHAIAHIALHHPPHALRATEAEVGAGATTDIIEAGPAQIKERPHAGALLGQNGAAGAYRDRDRLELEANIFALELLAPLDEVRACATADSNWTVAGLATYFGLSHEAMRHQLVAALLACPYALAEEEGEKGGEGEKGNEAAPPDLDAKQREAAETPAPALVVAGPGAGKTRVLAARFDYLVRSGVAPGKILALTFSNKAATEMQERLSATLPDHAAEIQVFTFHSLGLHLLTTYGTYLGYETTPRVVTDADAFVLLRSSLHRLPLGQFHNLADPTQNLDPIISRIGRLKDDLIDPANFSARVAAWQQQLEQQVPADLVAKAHHAAALDTLKKSLDLAAIYECYQEWLGQEGYVDYGDLVRQALHLFDHPDAADAIFKSYEHILVDEFQDINHACGQLVRALDGGRRIVWAVADPRQSIYGFRGAALSNLTDFSEAYAGARIVALDVNYRSVEEIVAAGQAIEFPNLPGGSALKVPYLRSSRGRGCPDSDHNTPPQAPVVVASEAHSQSQEIAEVVARVGEVAAEVPPEQIAILCHNRYLARDICMALEQAGIATNWNGGLEERDAFKDCMAVLLLALNQPQALLRLSRMEAHRLSEDDVRLLLNSARRRGNSLRAALKAAHLGQIEGLTAEGQQAASELARLAFKFRNLPHAWQVLVAYYLEESTWARVYFGDPRAASRRYLTSVNQMLELAREYALKGNRASTEGIAAFVDYITSSREAGKLPGADSTTAVPDAVNVLTIHRSKGLEWPVVFVPDWTCATQSPQEIVPLPDRFLRDKDNDNAAYSQACLYYVAVTRARDRLFLSRANRPNRDFVPYWDDIVESLAPRGLLQRHATKRQGWDRPSLDSRGPRVGVSEPIPYAMIRQYQYCSQRAKYDHVYGLSSGGGGYLFFVRRLRQTLRWIAGAARDGAVPGDKAVEAFLQAMWEDDAKAHRPLLPYYFEQARRCAFSFAARLQPGCDTRLDEAWHFERPGQPMIRFTIDEVDYGSQPIVRFHRYGKPSPRHAEDPVLCFYAGLTIEDKPVEVRLHYLETGAETTLDLSLEQPAFQRKLKDAYSAAHAIKNGVFEPKPRQFKYCNRCPYNSICPS